MDEQQLLRYSRHILLPAIDYAGQEKLSQSHVLIIGMGGLGSAVAPYLAAAGIGQLTLADFDDVDLSNLQRQIIHRTSSIGQNKALSAAQQLAKLNSTIQITAITEQLTDTALTQYATKADIIVDCSDNFTTRFQLNRISVQTQTPLVSGAAIRFEGQIGIFNPQNPTSSCYHCLYDETALEEENTCSTTGVLAPLVGVIGCVQAMEVIKLLTLPSFSSLNKLMTFNALQSRWRTMVLTKDPHCKICHL